ncbi:uracil-DNA glycosylase family 4 [Paraburkholderia sp. GAS41]|uniref:uracil-DNA glycosylase n=1 Tax=Paraburkholderia sp. GAS41 TaxID=3035134 RepID=UPI003D1E942B
MALHESVWEELGLAPRWVRRGMGQEAAGEAAASAVALETVSGGAGAPHASAAPGDDERKRATPPHAEGGRAPASRPTLPTQPTPAENSRATAPTQPTSAAPASRPTPPTRSTPAEPSSATPPPDDDFAWFDDLPAHAPADARAVPVEPVEASLQTLDWDALAERVAACERCRLCEKRTNTVFGVGDRQADWMLIGEAPGENEDRQGEPFVGQAGKLLDNMLRSLTLARDTNVYIANVIKCRPPGNRNPEPDEVARCEPYLQRQVALVKPKLIVALGRFAAQSLLKTDASISSLRGRVHAYEGVPVIVTYHPAYLLRSLPDKAKAWTDLCLARDTWLKADTDAGAAAG